MKRFIVIEMIEKKPGYWIPVRAHKSVKTASPGNSNSEVTMTIGKLTINNWHHKGWPFWNLEPRWWKQDKQHGFIISCFEFILE